ncbi:MAG: aminotransferase class V-fold PLP-dependent enzyme [Planctomycetes bacterium]|nr:aminotransferase class V-fold PLP-dependent enzyme [Planctomycetota bacterium]
MKSNHRLYLDNAATSWPKPDAVYDAVDRYQREIGAPNGRSGYREALQSNRIVERARSGVAELIGAQDPSRIVFGFNGTDVLNIAIRGVVRPGDHVVTTVCDHNSVLRPLRALRETADVSVSYVPSDGHGFVSPDDVRAALRPNTRLVAVNHASNVTGAIQLIEEIGRIVRESDALYLVDAAQSLGHVPIDIREFEVDLLAAPGHKGLLGPLGTAVLYIRPGVERELQPLRCGGTGTQSEVDRQPDELPEKYESGNHNLPGLAGLTAAVTFLHDKSIDAIHAHHTQLTKRLLDGLRTIASVTVHGPPTTANRTSVVSITVEGYDPQELAAVLESAHGIQCRAGLHCAPRMHESLGTTATGGTLRISPGYFTTFQQIDAVIATLQSVASVVSTLRVP